MIWTNRDDEVSKCKTPDRSLTAEIVEVKLPKNMMAKEDVMLKMV